MNLLHTALINLLDENLFTVHTGVATTKQTGKLPNTVRLNLLLWGTPIGSENIHILYIVEKFINVHGIVAFLNKRNVRNACLLLLASKG